MNIEEAIKWLEEKCYVESPQSETFEECCDIIEEALLKKSNKEVGFDSIQTIVYEWATIGLISDKDLIKTIDNIIKVVLNCEYGRKTKIY